MNANSTNSWAVFRILPDGRRERVNSNAMTEAEAKAEASRLLTESTAASGVKFAAKMLING